MKALSARTSLLLPCLLLAGCGGMGSHFAADRQPEFRYVPPSDISDEDRRICEARAKAAASDRGIEIASKKSTDVTARMFGAIGAVGVFSYVYEAEEAAYEEAYRECLRAKGYVVD